MMMNDHFYYLLLQLIIIVTATNLFPSSFYNSLYSSPSTAKFLEVFSLKTTSFSYENAKRCAFRRSNIIFVTLPKTQNPRTHNRIVSRNIKKVTPSESDDFGRINPNIRLERHNIVKTQSQQFEHLSKNVSAVAIQRMVTSIVNEITNTASSASSTGCRLSPWRESELRFETSIKSTRLQMSTSPLSKSIKKQNPKYPFVYITLLANVWYHSLLTLSTVDCLPSSSGSLHSSKFIVSSWTSAVEPSPLLLTVPYFVSIQRKNRPDKLNSFDQYVFYCMYFFSNILQHHSFNQSY